MSDAAILSLGRAFAYKVNALTERAMQEAGASPIATLALHRYALIPASAWALLFIHPHDLALILRTPHQVVYFLVILVLWNVQQWIHSYRINATSTASALTNLNNLLTLPLLLVVGIVLNHDVPRPLTVLAITVLVGAMLVKPAHHPTNGRARFTRPPRQVVALMAVEAVGDALLIGLCRQLLKEVPPHVFIGVFLILVLGACVVCVAVATRRRSPSFGTRVTHQPVCGWSIPCVFFAGSVMEFYAQATLPIYVVVAIGSVTFLMDMVSDLWRRRIRWNVQTAGFSGLACGGVALAVLAT